MLPKQDNFLDTFIVDFYSSYSSEIKVGHALGWSLFGISDTIEISTKNFTSSIALEPLDNVDGLDVLIYRTVDCATISRHVMLFDGNPYFNALIKIYNKCIRNKIDQINKESKCYRDKTAF